MKINSIEFHNYRCFTEGKMEFGYDKPLNLVLGRNGAGKTELLYAFWWVLHDFDFKNLKSKEKAPYALNSQNYRKLINDPEHVFDTCWVKLEFEHKNSDNKYIKKVLKRTIDYEKNSKKPREIMKVELYEYSENGEKSLAIRERKEVARIIEKIIPKKVLSGVLFDGERMRNLSSDDDNSVQAIEGTIQDITNQTMIEKMLEEVGILVRVYNREYANTARKMGNFEIADLEEEIDDAVGGIQNKKQLLMDRKKQLPQLEERIEAISREISLFEPAKQLEKARANLKKEQSEKERDLDTKLDNIPKVEFRCLGLLLSENLITEIDSLLDENDVPIGLTSSAVKNIITRGKCICGNEICGHEEENLTKLINDLPPENMNATLNEMKLNILNERDNKEQAISNMMDYIESDKLRLEEIKNELVQIQMKIFAYDDTKLTSLEKERTEILEKMTDLRHNIQTTETSIMQHEGRLNDLKKQQRILTEGNEDLTEVSNKKDFVEKTISVFESLRESKMAEGLSEINELMANAYRDISEEHDKGRRVYITQFVDKKYRLVSFYQEELNNYLEKAEFGKIMKKYKELNLDPKSENYNELHAREAAILEVAENNSTGQSKIMSMSFVKAILDYSLIDRSKKSSSNLSFAVSKEYPLMIDAPFSELSGDNLTKSAENLYKFNNQTIIMLDPDTYEGIKGNFSGHVQVSYLLNKSDGESKTKIEEVMTK